MLLLGVQNTYTEYNVRNLVEDTGGLTKAEVHGRNDDGRSQVALNHDQLGFSLTSCCCHQGCPDLDVIIRVTHVPSSVQLIDPQMSSDLTNDLSFLNY
jgi:hypothetical protein